MYAYIGDFCMRMCVHVRMQYAWMRARISALLYMCGSCNSVSKSDEFYAIRRCMCMCAIVYRGLLFNTTHSLSVHCIAYVENAYNARDLK